ncbi:MAG TPA: glycoside hydrolase family 32 protein [archaeon]|nr:glycoside hydrolase family 32 protein [archaeon]
MIHFIIDGKIEREFEVSLTIDEPDFWIFLDVSEFKGKKANLQTIEENETLDKIYQANSYPGEENIYKEHLRPQFHFSTRRGWINDPNGLVYHDGEYHLFYQHNPFGWSYGSDANKAWGHAISKDMIHWEELRDAIHPDNLGGIYSGSAVVDKLNTTSFQTGDEKPIVCIYTSAGGKTPWSKDKPFTQSIAFSNDRGRTFTKYSGNPVQEHIRLSNRDPKVIWYTPLNQWVIVLYLDDDEMGFFTSKDLKSWQLESKYKRDKLHECPELFELNIDGNKSNKKWILYAANGRYDIGQFDGKKFIPETKSIRLHYGNCFYASQTFNNIPKEDGRRIQIAWGVIPMQGMPFNQQMLFPVELTLRTTEDGPRLFAQPINEIKKIYGQNWIFQDNVVEEGQQSILGESFDVGFYDISAEFEIGSAERFGLIINNIQITYETKEQKLYCQERYASLKPMEGKIKFRILVDRTTLELFANDGQIYMPIRTHIDITKLSELYSKFGTDFNMTEISELYPYKLNYAVSYTDPIPIGKGDIIVFSKGGITKLVKLEVYELNSIWH